MRRVLGVRYGRSKLGSSAQLQDPSLQQGLVPGLLACRQGSCSHSLGPWGPVTPWLVFLRGVGAAPAPQQCCLQS